MSTKTPTKPHQNKPQQEIVHGDIGFFGEEPAEHFTGNAASGPAEARFDPGLLLEWISPSLFNPRKHFDPDALAELAASIKEHGVQQPLVVRDMGPGTSYLIVMGERRFRAAALAGRASVPALIRAGLTDLDHARLALEENVRRRDLTPMEEARGYKQCMDLGALQKDIGEQAGVGQSRISNLIRLLDLPEDVQALIDGGKLSAGHGIQLARYKDFPALCRSIAAQAVERGWAVRELEAGLTYNTASDALTQKIIVDLAAYGQTKFDWPKVCAKECPFGAFKGKSGQAGGGYCLRPAHYAQLNAEAEARTQEDARAVAERQRALAQERLAATGQDVVGAGDRAKAAGKNPNRGLAEAIGEQSAAQKAVDALKAAGDTLPRLDSLEYGARFTHGRPEGCSPDCPCAGKAVGNTGQIVDVCCDTRRLEGLKRQAALTEGKARKERLDQLRRQIQYPSGVPGGGREQRGMVLIAWEVLRNAKQGAKREVATRMRDGIMGWGGGLTDAVRAAVQSLLEQAGYMVKTNEAWVTLGAVPPDLLIGLTAEVLLRDELRSQQEYRTDATPKTTFFLQGGEVRPERVLVTAYGESLPATVLERSSGNVMVLLDGRNGKEPERRSFFPGQVRPLPEPDAPAPASRLHPCADCGLTDAGAFYVDGDGADVEKDGSMLGEWACLGCKAKREAQAAEDRLLCAGCGEPLPPGAFENANIGARHGALRMSSGELELADGRVFCDQCGPTVGDEGQPMAAGDAAPDSDNEAALCGCGEPTCLGTCADPSTAPHEGADDWSYDPPASRDAAFCGSCGVIPLTGGAEYCPDCDPDSDETPAQARKREGAALV